MLRFLFAVLAVSGLAREAIADSLKTEAELQPFVEGIMSRVAAGNFAGAFAAMKPFVIIPEAEFDALALSSKSQRDQFGTRYGKSVGYECLDPKKIGQSLERITCFEKTEKHALPWVFYFYKSPSAWVLNSFYWNDKLTTLFAE